MKKRTAAALFISIVLVSAILVVLALNVDWFPIQASSQAKDIDDLYGVMLAVSIPIFVIVVAVLLYSVLRFRARPGQENVDGPPIHGSTKLEAIWTVIPALLLFGLVGYTYTVLQNMEEPQPNTLRVNVTARQFAWTFEYPQAGKKKFASGDLYLPNDRPVRFYLQAKDVLHDFWVPEFRMKLDAVPGITTDFRLTPTRIGKYPVVCAELCGLGHSVMRTSAYVVSPAKFEAWLKLKQNPPKQSGKAIFASAGCGSCHTLKAAGTSAAVGPDLDKVLKGESAAFIKEAIEDPDADIASGYQKGVMPPNFGQTLTKQELTTLVNYIHKATS